MSMREPRRLKGDESSSRGASAALSKWARANRGSLVAASALCLGTLCLYMITNSSVVGRPEFDDYPFGSDPPPYIHGRGVPAHHKLSTLILLIYRGILGIFSVPQTGFVIKAPYALFSTAYVAVAIATFATLFGKFSARSIIAGACCAFTLMIWYFASVPESYALTNLLYAIYVLCLTRVAKHGITGRVSAAMGATLLVGLYNDISIVVLLVASAIVVGLRVLSKPGGKRFLLCHAAAIAFYVVHSSLNQNLLKKYLSFFFEYSPIKSERPEVYGYIFDFPGTVMNFFFYSLAAPRQDLTHAPWLANPAYHLFFDPSPQSYWVGLTALPFIAVYLSLFTFARVSRFSRLTFALLVFLVCRFALTVGFNPPEAILYASVAVLPGFMILFKFVEHSPFTYKTALLSGFAGSLFLANASFFVNLR